MDASYSVHLFKKPDFKKKYYVSHTEKPIYYNLTDVTVKQIIKLKNDKGYMLTIKAEAHKPFFDEVDNASIEQLADKNRDWFDNDLTEEDIRQMFNPSYCLQNNVVSVFLPSHASHASNASHAPTGSDIKDQICNTAGKVLNLKIQHIGMYIYPDQTVNRWAVKTINMHNIDDVHLTETKEDIEAYWQEQVNKCNKALDCKIIHIQETKEKLNHQFSSIVAEKFSNKDWECKIRDLQTLIQNIIF